MLSLELATDRAPTECSLDQFSAYRVAGDGFQLTSPM
jgi:hypothetical protein